MRKTDEVIIFIADQDELVNMALRHEIEKAFVSHRISIFTFSDHAQFELLMKHTPDIVIMDVKFNENSREITNGLTLIGRLKAHNPRTQAIILADEESAEIAVKALHLGAHDYVVKNGFMFKKIRLSLIQCFTIMDLRRNMKKQVGLGIMTLILFFLMFGLAIGLSAHNTF